MFAIRRALCASLLLIFPLRLFSIRLSSDRASLSFDPLCARMPLFPLAAVSLSLSFPRITTLFHRKSPFFVARSSLFLFAFVTLPSRGYISLLLRPLSRKRASSFPRHSPGDTARWMNALFLPITSWLLAAWKTGKREAEREGTCAFEIVFDNATVTLFI